MTKKEMIAHCRREVAKAGGGACYEFHVYTDEADRKRSEDAGNYSALNGETPTEWKDLHKWVAHGRVFDVFVYDATGWSRNLDYNVLIEIP